MNAIARIAPVLSLALAAAVVFGGTEARAQEPINEEAKPRLYIAPGMPQPPTLQYKLGITGFVNPGEGMRLTSVRPYGPATRVNVRWQGEVRLEAGDVIVQINGRPINSFNDYVLAMNSRGGRVEMLIRDVRGTGYVQGQTYGEPVSPW